MIVVARLLAIGMIVLAGTASVQAGTSPPYKKSTCCGRSGTFDKRQFERPPANPGRSSYAWPFRLWADPYAYGGPDNPFQFKCRQAVYRGWQADIWAFCPPGQQSP